ncbi:MAG TPA: hypothetical protein VFP95_01470 [Gammaproteobacteria bacterium]|nr:hypothetical protein [Gammaproteobacteria bacterium]
MKKAYVVFVFLLFGLTGCVSMKPVELAQLPVAKPDMGLVFFYRKDEFAGSAVNFRVYHGKKVIGALGSGTFFYYYCKPGEQVFWSETEVKDSVYLDILPGKVYYVNGETDMGFWAARPDLTVIPAIQGKSEIHDLTYAVPK